MHTSALLLVIALILKLTMEDSVEQSENNDDLCKQCLDLVDKIQIVARNNTSAEFIGFIIRNRCDCRKPRHKDMICSGDIPEHKVLCKALEANETMLAQAYLQVVSTGVYDSVKVCEVNRFC
ncbi:hypothetical protein DdX_13922 [Ditylenchus destructor]|uniref:Saposin B-type domain-containing protein n=1 Tax=Ditylenchus destructor TaxID=166010 RepID=A0AAD4QW40_9BILA|nr:hypothetical protein DdX_13922 [Ditylenchus destructor]